MEKFFKNNDRAWMLMYDFIPTDILPLMDERGGVTGTVKGSPFECDSTASMWTFEVDNSSVSFMYGTEPIKEFAGLREKIATK